eukprot:3100433-Amphidinium_carterae.1
MDLAAETAQEQENIQDQPGAQPVPIGINKTQSEFVDAQCLLLSGGDGKPNKMNTKSSDPTTKTVLKFLCSSSSSSSSSSSDFYAFTPLHPFRRVQECRHRLLQHRSAAAGPNHWGMDT